MCKLLGMQKHGFLEITNWDNKKLLKDTEEKYLQIGEELVQASIGWLTDVRLWQFDLILDFSPQLKKMFDLAEYFLFFLPRDSEINQFC